MVKLLMTKLIGKARDIQVGAKCVAGLLFFFFTTSNIKVWGDKPGWHPVRLISAQSTSLWAMQLPLRGTKINDP